MTTTLFGAAEAQAARALVGGTAIGDVRNELLKQILVATANKVGGIAGVAWGGITGTLSNQADLQEALDLKLDKTGGAFTGLTGAGFRDTSAAFDVTQTFTSSTVLDGARSITWDVKNASHELKFMAASIVTFPSGTNTLLGSAVANTITTNGAASTPALHGSGTIFSGGSATSTKPYWLIEPAGVTSTGWNTSGTGLGVNVASGIVADFQKSGVSIFNVDASGNFARAVTSIQFGTGAVNFCGISVHGSDNLLFNSDDNYCMKLYSTGLVFQSTGQFSISDGNAYSGTPDIGFARTSAGVGRISNGSTGRGTLDAAGYQVGGVAGTSGTITAASTVTVVNGIVTVIA